MDVEEKIYSVYVHINKINQKAYVGQTKNIQRRWRNKGIDYYSYEKNIEEQLPFWKAIQKYGWDNFDHIILKSGLTLREANYWENYYINQYHSRVSEHGYNIREGGSNGALTEATKQKLSDIMKEKGRWKGDNNPRHLDPLFGERNGMYGKIHSEETKEKISQALTGRTLSEENKQNISKSLKQHHPRAKKVRCIETGEIFNSARQAAESCGATCGVSRVCNGQRETAFGKHWEWVENNDINT